MESAPWLVSGRAPWRVLIVEDEDLVRSILADMVELSGYEVCGQARDGYEATRMVGTTAPDVILMDIMMPTMNGVEALQLINASRPTCAVFLSAYCSPSLLDQVTAAGAQGYLVKPCQPSDLVPAIETAIAQFQRSRVAEEAERIEIRFQRAWAEQRAGGSIGPAVAQALADACGVMGHTAFALAVRRGTRLYTRIAHGVRGIAPGRVLGPADGRLGAALQRQTSCQLRLVGAPTDQTSVLSAPVNAGPAFTGCLYLFAPEGRRFTHREERLISTTAHAAAGLLQRLQASCPQSWQRWLRRQWCGRTIALRRR
ncbi:MAG: response regulator [Armatimonadetes bacterium]|nr:response regulator [Armatimonadota bacterium]